MHAALPLSPCCVGRTLFRCPAACVLQLKRIRREFDKFDADNSRLLDMMEFKQFMTSLHPDLQPSTWHDCKKLFERYDSDGSGFIDLKEFTALYQDLFGKLEEDDKKPKVETPKALQAESPYVTAYLSLLHATCLLVFVAWCFASSFVSVWRRVINCLLTFGCHSHFFQGRPPDSGSRRYAQHDDALHHYRRPSCC